MTLISEKPLIELVVYVDGEERSYFISGHNGRFNWGLLEKFESDLSSDPLKDIESIIEQNTDLYYGSITLLATLTEIEPETQYGTGYGDVLTLDGYYYLTIISVTKVEIDVRPADVEDVVYWG